MGVLSVSSSNMLHSASSRLKLYAVADYYMQLDSTGVGGRSFHSTGNTNPHGRSKILLQSAQSTAALYGTAPATLPVV